MRGPESEPRRNGPPGMQAMASETVDDLARALRQCRPTLLWVLGFSLFVNALMLVPALYMLQVYDRVITTGKRLILFALTASAISSMSLSSVCRNRNRIALKA